MYIELSEDSIMASYQEPVVWDIDRWYSVVLVRALRMPFFQEPSLIDQSLEYNKIFIADEFEPNSTHYSKIAVKQTPKAVWNKMVLTRAGVKNYISL